MRLHSASALVSHHVTVAFIAPNCGLEQSSHLFSLHYLNLIKHVLRLFGLLKAAGPYFVKLIYQN